MAGHSKWHNIQARKGKQDAKRGKIFTKLGREIMVAVKQGGPDIDGNATLATVVAKAKANNMPNDTIANAIKRASGASSAENYDEIIYEGYGPNGVAITLEVMTDNKNRAAAEVRHAFSRCGGNLGTPGCVSYLFEKKGQIIIEKASTDKTEDEILEIILEAGGEDLKNHSEVFEILTEPNDFGNVLKELEKHDIKPMEAAVAMLPTTEVELDSKTYEKIENLISNIEDLDDVQNVYHNATEAE